MKHWEDLVLETAERFGGQLPQPATAQDIADAYAKAPHAVNRAIDATAEAYDDGTIRSPWGILKSRVDRIQTTAPKTEARNDRERAIARAEQWIRNAGMHYDRESEILDELFGDRGTLRAHDTPETRQRTIELWQTLRPVAEAIEHEHEVFMHRWAEHNGHLEKTNPKPAETTTEIVS